MINTDIKKQLNSIDINKWIVSKYTDNPELEIRWLRLVQISSQGTSYIGISEDIQWLVETSQGVLNLNSENNFLPLLPLLESGKPSFLDNLKSALGVYNISPEFAEGFPFSHIVTYVLNFSSAYWKELAVGCIERSEVIITDEIEESLRSIMNSKWPQNLRHRIKKLVVARH